MKIMLLCLLISGVLACSSVMKSYDDGYEDGYDGASRKSGIIYGEDYRRGYEAGVQDDYDHR